jgi:hypothetical protein
LSLPPAPSRSEWASIHGEAESWRTKLIGDISGAFVVPRYVRLFYDTFAKAQQWDFCEIGSGNGDMPKAILASNRGTIRRYVTSEVFPEGVEWLRRLGLESVQADAEALPWTDGEFDAAIAFDVVHHVAHPRVMAREMMRVGRGSLLLVESNGLSIFRRMREMTPGHRRAGERSYTPWQYRKFFEGHKGLVLDSFELAPFLFPFKCPRWFLPLLVRFNAIVERIPVIRWQCSSVWIRISYHQVET